MAKKTATAEQPKKKRGSKLLPPDLVTYIEAGNPVRTTTDDPLPGRCGAEKQHNSSRSPYCLRLAGHNTYHKGRGRCHSHEGQNETGLAPWVGEISEDQWFKITGARRGQPGSGDFKTTHSATEALRPFEKIMAKRLSPEDLESYMNAPVDANEVIDANLRERHMAKDRIYRYLQRVNTRVGQAKAEVLAKAEAAQAELSAIVEAPTPADEKDRQKAREQVSVLVGRISQLRADARQLDHYADTIAVEVEPTLNKVTGILARLLEVKARFQELQGTEESRGLLLDAFRSMNDDQFSRLKHDPVAMSNMLAGFGGVQR